MANGIQRNNQVEESAGSKGGIWRGKRKLQEKHPNSQESCINA